MNYQELLYSPITPPEILPLIQKASHNIFPVLIQGEPGTGKELVAKMIHHTGVLKSYRFYKIDCKLLTEDEPHDQLYRLLQGFNGETNPVTLYLKGVEYLGQFNQLRLLGMMEDGVFQDGMERRIGQNFRFISSSSDHLREKVIQRKFSEDLYNRLNTLSIRIPPLRERAQEIPKISQYILTEYSKKMKIKKVNIAENALNLLESYWWPGNLTELEQVVMRSAVISEDEIRMEKDFFFGTENEKNSFVSFLKKAELKPSESKEEGLLNEQNIPFLSLFIIELVHRIKNPLVSIKTFTQLLKEKYNDAEFKEYFYRIVVEDIEKIDSLLNILLNYIKINTPILKTNTVHNMIEEILKNNKVQLENKKIKLFKKFGKDFPEIVIHDEQLRFILNSILQYAIPIIPLNGSIGFLTKLFDVQMETGYHKTSPQKGEGYVEILIVFTGHKKAMEQFETVLGIPPAQGGEAIELELRLVKEMVKKNGGTMKFKSNENNPQTFISLKFPIERRKKVYYQSNI